MPAMDCRHFLFLGGIMLQINGQKYWIMLAAAAVINSFAADAPPLKVEIKDMPKQITMVVKKTIKRNEIAAELGQIYGKIFGYAHPKNIKPLGAPFMLMTKMTADTMDIEAGAPVAEGTKGEGDILISELPGGKIAVATHAGPYENLPKAWEEFKKQIAEKKLEASGNPWEVYTNDPTTVKPEEIKTELYLPVK
jgi:effector-binding domain-containing protein